MLAKNALLLEPEQPINVRERRAVHTKNSILFAKLSPAFKNLVVNIFAAIFIHS